MEQQTYIRQDEESKTLVPVYAKRIFDLRWLAGNSLDRQEDGNMDEKDAMAGYLDRIADDQLIAETNPSESACVNVNHILSGLSGVQVEEKRLARITLEAIKELIEIEEPGSIRHLLPVAKSYLDLRIEDIDNILYYLNTARLKPFRALVMKENTDFISRVESIKDMFNKTKYNPAFGSANGLLKTVKPYLEEPDLEGLEDMLKAAIRELNKLRGPMKPGEPEISKSRVRFWLGLVGNKLKDSQLLNEFMALFRTEYARRRCDGNQPYLKEDAFIDVFERFVKQKQLIRGSPRTKALQILSYLAVFVSLYVDNPLKPSERIPNPVFKPVNTLRLIVEVDDIETIINVKRLKERKSTIDKLKELKTKRFIHELNYEERKDLIRAMGGDFGLSDKERFELAKAFAISRENLRKAYPGSALPAKNGLCDSENPDIIHKAQELTSHLEDESYKANALWSWISVNVEYGIGYGGYWDALASETMNKGRGMCFNTANLLIAMARAIGIKGRYGVVKEKKEAYKDSIPAERYAKMKETTEHVFAELFIDNSWKKFDIKRREDFDVPGPPYYSENIDELALTKAKKDTREKRDRYELGRQSLVSLRSALASDSEFIGTTLGLGQAIINAISATQDIASENIKGKAIILYADDILERGAAGDLAYTLSNTQVLNNSTIVIYGRNPGRAQLLEKIINEAVSDKSISMVKIETEDLKGYNGYEELNVIYPNEAKELELVIRRLAAHHKINNEGIFGVIKGMTNESSLEAVKKFTMERYLPVVSFEDDKGIYSFKKALAELIAITKDDTLLICREWYRILKPIEKEDVEKAYQDYRRALEIAINA